MDLARVAEDILVHARDGYDEDHICGMVGIHPNTFKRWVRLGLDDEEQKNEYAPGKTYGNFYIRLLAAQGYHRKELSDELVFRDPKSIAFILKNQYPDHFGDKKEININTSSISYEQQKIIFENVPYEQIDRFIKGEITIGELTEFAGILDAEVIADS